MAKNNNVKDFTKDIADAIRAKENSVAKINPQDFSARIAALSVGGSPKFAELVDGSITSVEANDLKDVESIASHTFMFKQNLINVNIPSNVKSIGEKAFMGTSIETLTLAEGVETIGNSAFSITNIRELVLPSSLTSVGEFAFSDIGLLEKVTIKSGITSLPNRLFDGCDGLTEVYMESTTPPSVGVNTFPSTAQIYVLYGAYDDYVASWTDYASQIVRLPAIPSTITVIVNDYTGALVSGASVTISGNGQTYTGTTDGVGTFTQGDLQPATYTISVADMEGFKTPASSEVVVEEDTQNSVTVTYLEKPSISSVFGENAPDQIAQVANEISAKNMTSAEVESAYGWKIGDTVSYTLSTGEPVTMRIIGFCHDDLSDGSGKAGITLEMTHCLKNGSQMHSSSSSSGYSTSIVKTHKLPSIKQTIPEEWQNIIKFVDKKSANGGGHMYTLMLTLSEDLFLLCGKEVDGSGEIYAGGQDEGVRYEYYTKYTSTTSRIKQRDSDGDGIPDTAFMWWLRSADKQYSTQMGEVSARGELYHTSQSNSDRISYAFCIGSAADYVPSTPEEPDTPTFSRTFSENTPEQISAISAEISANNMTSAQVAETYGWNIGDKAQVVSPINGRTLHLQIMGYNHDINSETNEKVGISFQFEELLDTFNMGGANYFEAGTTPLMNTLLGHLPSEWQSVVKTVKKSVLKTYNDSTLITQDVKLFLPAYAEVYSSIASSYQQYEGTLYEYWKNNGSNSAHIKESKAWWLRSYNGSKFYVVGFDGKPNYFASTYSISTCPMFCV